MNYSLIRLFLLPVAMLFLVACNNDNSNNTFVNSETQELYNEVKAPSTPDTSTYLKVADFLSPQEIDSIINLPTLLSNKRVRIKGIASVPQNGDDFRKVNLDGVYWHNVSVVEGDFRGAIMRSAKANESIFEKSDFRVADLRWTFFNRSIMSECNFNQAKLFHVHVNHTNLNNCTFRGANMFGLEGHHAKMRNCNMTNALMKDSEFIDADFTGSLFVSARLIRAVMSGSNFDYVNCFGADFSGGNLDSATFRHANCKGANFQGSGMRNTDFSGANLDGCNFFGARMWHTNFNGAQNIPENVKELMVDGKVTANILKR